MIYNNLKIKQNVAGGIELFLDGKQLKGCQSAELELEVGAIPMLTATILVQNVDVDIEKCMGKKE